MRTLLFTGILFTLLARTASAQILYDYVHECSTTSTHQEAIHERHGNDHCGNTDENGVGQPETCTQEIIKSDGQLIRGEWMACGEHSGPGGGSGCSWDIVQRCGGQIRSGNVSTGLSYDGSYPRCRVVPVLLMPSGSTPGYQCSWRTSANTEYFHVCYCGADGVFFCQ